MIDVWRFCNPDQFRYTWFKMQPNLLMERLDYILVSESLNLLIKGVGIEASFKFDHAIPWMSILKNDLQRGTGFWKFNTSLLDDDEYVNNVKGIIHTEIAIERPQVSLTLEMIKLAVRGYSIQYSTYKKKERDQTLNQLQNKLTLFEVDFSQTDNDVYNQDLYQQIIDTKKQIDVLNSQKAAGAMLGSQANWLHYCKKKTKYFFGLESFKQNKRNFLRIKLPDDTVTEDQSLIAKEQVRFFKTFYDELGSLLYRVFQEAIANGRLHLSACRCAISLMEKQGRDPLYLTNRRPLTLMNVDYKIFPKTIALRIRSVIDTIIHRDHRLFER